MRVSTETIYQSLYVQSRARSKGFDLSTVTEVELDAVADELKERPRRRLDFATPTEQLSELLLQ
jgi:IS30 family transposase